MAHSKISNTFRWQAGCACCGAKEDITCDVCRDDFSDGVDGEPLSDKDHWDTSGASVLYDTQRAFVPSGNWAVCNHENPTQWAIVRGTVELQNPATVRYCANWSDSDNYRYVELVVESDICAELRIGERSGGSDTIMARRRYTELTGWLTDKFLLRLCVRQDKYLIGAIDFDTGPEGIDGFSTADFSGRQAGFTSISGNAFFDDFRHIIHKNDEQPEWLLCPECDLPPNPCLIWQGTIAEDFPNAITDWCAWDFTGGLTPNVGTGRIDAAYQAKGACRIPQNQNDWDMVVQGGFYLDTSGPAHSLKVYVNDPGDLTGAIWVEYDWLGDQGPGVDNFFVRLWDGESVGFNVNETGVCSFQVCLQSRPRPDGQETICGNYKLPSFPDWQGGPCTSAPTLPDQPYSGFEVTNGTVQLVNTWTFFRGDDADCPYCIEYQPPPECSICSGETLPLEVTVTIPPVGNGPPLGPCASANCPNLSDGSPWVLAAFPNVGQCVYRYDASPGTIFCGAQWIQIQFVDDPVGGGGKMQFIIGDWTIVPDGLMYEKVYAPGDLYLDCSNLNETLNQVGDLGNLLCIWPATITVTS